MPSVDRPRFKPFAELITNQGIPPVIENAITSSLDPDQPVVSEIVMSEEDRERARSRHDFYQEVQGIQSAHLRLHNTTLGALYRGTNTLIPEDPNVRRVLRIIYAARVVPEIVSTLSNRRGVTDEEKSQIKEKYGNFSMGRAMEFIDTEYPDMLDSDEVGAANRTLVKLMERPAPQVVVQRKGK